MITFFFISVENSLSSINYYTTWKERKKLQKKTNQSGLDHFKLLNELQMTPSRANPIWFQDIAKAYLITSLFFFLIFGKLKQRSSLIVFINNLILIIEIIIIIIIII